MMTELLKLRDFKEIKEFYPLPEYSGRPLFGKKVEMENYDPLAF